MSLLREIQDATCNQELKLANTLRKCKILAVRLNHALFKNWVDSELNGYQPNKNLPTYRIINNAELQGNFNNGFILVSNFSIPTLHLPEEYSNMLTTLFFLRVSVVWKNLLKIQIVLCLG